MAASVAFVLICLWRSSSAQGGRPTVGFGAPWRDIVLAWLPEGIVLGLLSFAAQRIFGGRQGATRGIPVATAGFYLILWLPVWTLGVIVPGGTVLNVFSNSLSPLKETFYAGGPVGGIVAGGVLLAYASICLVVVVIELLAATAWAGLTQSTMIASALQGSITCQPDAHIGWVLRSAILVGALFWSARLIVIAIIEGPLWRGVVDAAVTVLLIGIYARHIASRPKMPPRGPSSTPASGARANSRGA